MWELRKKSARGRLSLRRFSLVATAVLMAIFVLTSALSPKALAADAVREGDNVTYDGHTFMPMANAQRPSGLQQDVSGYISLDEANKKAHFILTTGDPSKATTGQYVIYDFTPPANFSNPSPPVSVGIASASTNPGDTPKDDNPTSCNGQFLQGIGWILCPVVNFLASGMDHLYEVLTGFLVVQPAQANENNSLFRMWSIVRNIANICFVIAFLIVIYSQVTGLGISNYGIKKTMPRLVIAAILVNISFWVCAIAIDISNTLGYGLHSLFMGVFDSLNTAGTYQDLTWSNVAATLLSGTAVTALAAYGIYSVAAAGITGTLIMFIPTLVGVLMSILVALLVISVRQALITCLVIVSPLAFVAFLLPNTEKYFTKWRELFMTLLLVYPIFSVVFGGAQLAGMAIIQNAGGSLNLIILGMAVQIAPVVVTPLLLKVSGALLGKVAGLIGNPRQTITGKSRTWAEGRAAEAKAKSLATGRASRLTQAIDSQRRWREGLRKEYETAASQRFEGSARGESLEEFRRRNVNTKKRIDNNFARSPIGMTLERESLGLDVDKTNIQSDMMDTAEGRALEARTRMAQVRKVEVENNFEATTVAGQVDRARREAERTKQTLEAGHEHAWHYRNLSDAGSQEREIRLRTATDKAADTKERVSAVYDDVKANKDGAKIIGAVVDAVTLKNLSDDAFAVAQSSSATAARKARSSVELSKKINQELLKNTQYQKDAAGNIVLDAQGRRIITSGREIDGVDIQAYATGIGERKVMLAGEVEKARKIDEQESNAAYELMKQFELEAGDFDKLATKAGAKITKTDAHNNEITFEFDDEAARSAAISWIAKYGSYNQREKLSLSSAKGGPNGEMSGFIQRELSANGFGAMAPWANDITQNELGQGRIRNQTDIMFHNFREIHEGRPKAESIAGSNNTALAKLYGVFDDRSNNTPQWSEYMSLNEDLIRRQMDGSPQADIDAAIQDFRTMAQERFDTKYYDLIEETERILADPRLRAQTTAQSRAEMEAAVATYRSSALGQQQRAYHDSIDEARKRVSTNTATPADIALLQHVKEIYKK